MKGSGALEPVRQGENAMSIICISNQLEIARFMISPYASPMLNMELTRDIIRAYEKYYRAIQKAAIS